ncbi:MAG: sugar kinase [Actinomycetales bacterium]|nr:sugar kinase [Actinomycetales bacterium]
MAQRYVIAIDNGSQSTKVSIIDRDGTVVSEARQALRPSNTPRPGVVEHPDDDIWESIGVASRTAMAQFDGDPADIAGVGLCTIRFCRAMLRADGSLASPVLSWMDERVSRPYVPDDPTVRYVTTSSGYVTHRLTGEFRDTAANYQGVWPISTDRWSWLEDSEGFADYGIDRAMLVELVMPGEPLGAVTRDAARHTGIEAGTPVFATANDKAVEALGSGLRTADELLVSLGTYIAAMSLGTSNRTDATGFWSNFASTPHDYLYESLGVRRGMWTVSWWRDLLGAEVLDGAAGSGQSPDQFLDDGATLVGPGSDGLMVILDWLAPTDQPFRKGSILGFDARHGRFHVHRAILEGIALTMARHTRAMASELERDFTQLILSGGGAQSPLFAQIFADVFDLPVTRSTVSNGAGLGAAICAAVGSAMHPSWDAAVASMVHWREPVVPIHENHERYQQLAAIYDGVPQFTDSIYRSSFEIFH